MPIVERPQVLAKERGTNFKQLEAICGIGNGVMRRWDVQSPRVDTLVKVADYLNVSLDYLVYGKEDSAFSESNEPRPNLDDIKRKQGLLCDGSPLTSLETDLVAMFRILPEEEQEDVFDIVHLKYKRRLSRKRESIYWTYFEEDGGEESGPAEGHETYSGTA